MENHATIENAKRFTVGKITCSIVPAKHDDNFDELVLSHSDYDFDCIISCHSLRDYKPKETSGIFVHPRSKDTILSNLGLTYQQGYTIRDSVNSTRKYGETKNIISPNRVNLRTVNSSRFEKFANNWFEFLNTVEWSQFCKEAQEMHDNLNTSNKRVTDLLEATNNSVKIEHDRETIVRNDFCRMTYPDYRSSTQVEVTTYSMTEEQKVELFKFLDAMSKQKTKF